MLIVLDAMMAVMFLITLFTVPSLHRWVHEYLRHNPGVGRFIHFVVALMVVIPALWVAVSWVDHRTVDKSPELIRGIAIGLSVAWFAVSTFLPIWLLAHRSWDAATKELFRLVVGVFLFSYVVLFVWWVADVTSAEQRFKGHAAWAMPVASLMMLGLEYLLLKLGLRLFPPDQPRLQ